jgi:hypothetical protein
MDPELFKRMQEAALRFRSGESDVEEIMTPNGLARLVRDPTNQLGFRIDFVGEGAKHSVAIQNYPPSRTRPHGYPAPLPFLPNCRATVDTLDQSVSWTIPTTRSARWRNRVWTTAGWRRRRHRPRGSSRRTAPSAGCGARTIHASRLCSCANAVWRRSSGSGSVGRNQIARRPRLIIPYGDPP